MLPSQYYQSSAAECHQDEPESNSAYSQFDAFRGTMSVIDIEIKEVTTGIMSMLTNNEDVDETRFPTSRPPQTTRVTLSSYIIALSAHKDEGWTDGLTSRFSIVPTQRVTIHLR